MLSSCTVLWWYFKQGWLKALMLKLKERKNRESKGDHHKSKLFWYFCRIFSFEKIYCGKLCHIAICWCLVVKQSTLYRHIKSKCITAPLSTFYQYWFIRKLWKSVDEENREAEHKEWAVATFSMQRARSECFSHFSNLWLLVLSILHPSVCDPEINLSMPRWKMSHFFKCTCRREERGGLSEEM